MPARPREPSSSTTSTSTVGLPRLSRISRPMMSTMAVMAASQLAGLLQHAFPACKGFASLLVTNLVIKVLYMQLSEWLDQNGLSVADFAGRVKASRVTVHRYLNGNRIPTKAVMARIVAETSGNVTTNDFFD